MEVKPKDVLELEIDGKGRVLIPAEKRYEHNLDEGDRIEIALLGKRRDSNE